MNKEKDKIQKKFISNIIFKEGYNKALDEVEKIVKEIYYNKRYCPHCERPLLQDHLCDYCKKRVACGDEIPTFAFNEILEKLKTLREK